MKIAYAFRRCALYPYNGAGFPTGTADRKQFLGKIKAIGFDGIELPAMNLSDAEVANLRSELEGAGVPCVAIRGGGGAAHPRVAAANKQSMLNAIHFASKVGADVVNSTVTTPPRAPNGKGTYRGNLFHRVQVGLRLTRTMNARRVLWVKPLLLLQISV